MSTAAGEEIVTANLIDAAAGRDVPRFGGSIKMGQARSELTTRDLTVLPGFRHWRKHERRCASCR
jgi:hypothetical protein